MIEVDQQTYCIDPAGGVVDWLGKKWALPLIGVMGNRSRWRFNEVLEAIEGVGSKLLAERLLQAARIRLVVREVFPEIPVRIEYRLTERGAALRRALVPLLSWASTEPPGTVTAPPSGRGPSGSRKQRTGP